jgi:hypothetical protein
MSTLVGCISLNSPDMQWAMSQTIGLPATTSVQLSAATSAYYRCHQKWPASLDELRSLDCADAGKRQQISNFLSGIQWEAMTNVMFKPMPDGKLAISMTFIGRTATTNGTSVGWNGADVTATLDSHELSEEGVSIGTLSIQETPKK